MSRLRPARIADAARFALLALAVFLLPFAAQRGQAGAALEPTGIHLVSGHSRPVPFSETHLLPANAGASGAIVPRSGGKRDGESKTPPPIASWNRAIIASAHASASCVPVARCDGATSRRLSARSTRAPPQRSA